MKKIPIRAAKHIAEVYDYDQVVIIARKVDCGQTVTGGGEHVTTYGVNPAHCEVAARIGTTLKHHLMKWPSRLFQTGLRVVGIGRDAENPNALSICCAQPVTDDDIRAVHDFLKPTS